MSVPAMAFVCCSSTATGREQLNILTCNGIWCVISYLLYVSHHIHENTSSSHIRRLHRIWYQKVIQGGHNTHHPGTSKQLTTKFVTWLQSRPNTWFPVNKLMAAKLCLKTITAVPEDPTPTKRTRPLHQPAAMPAPRSKKKREANPTVTWTASATPVSASDDGAVEQEWIKSTVEEWRQRPEPHRSGALRELMRTIKVQDGESMEYVTLFAWAAYQKQSQYITAIRQLVAARCVQEKVSEAKYKNDLVPHYTVIVTIYLCIFIHSP